jgi:hypothetical protein
MRAAQDEPSLGLELGEAAGADEARGLDVHAAISSETILRPGR